MSQPAEVSGIARLAVFESFAGAIVVVSGAGVAGTAWAVVGAGSGVEVIGAWAVSTGVVGAAGVVVTGAVFWAVVEALSVLVVSAVAGTD